jgi:GntR family transcriptional regulator
VLSPGWATVVLAWREGELEKVIDNGVVVTGSGHGGGLALSASAPGNLQVRLDHSSRVPIFYQIAEQLKLQIEDGRLAAGSLLGNEIRFAAELAVSRPTVRRAIEMLVEQGLVARRRGIGTVVLPNRIRRRLAVPSLYDDLKASGRGPTTRVLSLSPERSDHEVIAMLGVDPETLVLRIVRLRCADGAPLALMTNWVPRDIVDPRPDDLERTGLYELLRSAGVVPKVVDETVGARLAGKREARLLEIKSREAVLTLSVVAYGANGQAAEVGRHVYRADRYSFDITHVNA